MAKAPEPVRPVIVKKIYEAPHGGHHGGAWKVAYADFVTAMMAFFLLMWLLGSTDEKKRKALADYFSPTLTNSKQDNIGSTGFFGGDSLTSADAYPNRAGQTGTRTMTIPRDAKGGPKEASGRGEEKNKFEQIKQALQKKLEASTAIRRLAHSLKFTITEEGMRIDLIDDADFTMFVSGTDQMTPDAVNLLSEVTASVRTMPNGLIIRGHTDAAPMTRNPGASNWQLSVERAEATRRFMARAGLDNQRFARIEGVADREPIIPGDKFDPRNRRMSVTLTWGHAIEPVQLASSK
jgi:chemotaxis protein MotB